MDYMLMFYETADEAASQHDERAEAYWAGWIAYIGAMQQQAGVMKSGEGLQPPSMATTLRLQGGASPRAGRPLCRHEGAARRLRHPQPAEPGRCARLGGPRALRCARRGRGAAGHAAAGRLGLSLWPRRWTPTAT